MDDHFLLGKHQVANLNCQKSCYLPLFTRKCSSHLFNVHVLKSDVKLIVKKVVSEARVSCQASFSKQSIFILHIHIHKAYYHCFQKECTIHFGNNAGQ